MYASPETPKASLRYTVLMILFFVVIFNSLELYGQSSIGQVPKTGYEERISVYVDSLRVFDTHEHLLDPEILKIASSFDFTVLFQENGKNDLLGAGMSDTYFAYIFNSSLTPEEKWGKIEPYWNNSFNTASNRVILIALKNLFGINDLNRFTVGQLSQKMSTSYQTDWFDHVLREICKIDYVIQDGDPIKTKDNCIRNVNRFTTWITLDSKRTIDSLAIMQIKPIYKLEDLVENLKNAFLTSIDEGMVAIKIDLAYIRTLNFENVTTEAAGKVFKTLVNGNSDYILHEKEARTFQDYMVHQLLILAQQYNIPVAFHTGIQAGHYNSNINNANPVLLTNLFMQFPDLRFALFHGSYPFGGELSALAKNFKNVYIDMNWTYSISPAYAERYLEEWLETVPASKIMAFGGDQRFIENTYGNLVIAKKIISNVLIRKVGENYLSESEAKKIAKMLLYENGMTFYNIH